jgi:lipopolysaccharide export system permease protein
MTVIGRLLTRMIAIRFLVILLGISIFVLTLDILTNLDDILAYADGDTFVVLRYAWLRLPLVAATFWNLSVLLAVLLTLVELGYRNEIVAIWAAGISPLRILIMLLPLGLALGTAQFLLNDQANPRTARELREWGVGDYAMKKLQLGENEPIWMRAGNDILRAGRTNRKATQLEDVTIFRRDEEGLLLEQMIARSARLVNGRWVLRDVYIYARDNIRPERLDVLIYSGNLRLAAAGARSGDPEEMTLSDLDYFIANAGFGIRPPYVYEAWWHKRISLFVLAWLVMSACIPLAARYRRGGVAGYVFGVGVAIGFGYFILDGLAMTVGEMGLVPPWLAAWLPAAVLALISAALLVRAESLR